MRLLRPRPLVAAACLLFAAGIAHAATSPKIDRIQKALAVLEAEKERLHVPGMAVAIVDHDRVVLMKGLGVRDLATKAPVDSFTVFPIGSCTKSFTGMAAVLAQAQGKLSLDDPPRRWLPWFHMADPEADALVQLRDLLSHRTGLLEYNDLAAEFGVTREEYLKAATGAEPVAKLRSEFHYSNAMITAGGECVARAMGTTWERAIERLLLEPLGMRHSAASTDEMARMPNHATGYDDPTGNGTWKPTPVVKSLAALAPAGAVVSCAHDMARWLRFLLAEGEIEGTRLASRDDIRMAVDPHIEATPSLAYGLGWVLYEWNGYRVVEHNGGSSGLSAIVSFLPEKQVGFVLLVNTTPTSLTGITNAGKLLWPILTGEDTKAANFVWPKRNRGAESDTAALDTTDLPEARTLLARMTQAAGGRTNLEHARNLTTQAERHYRNQGVRSRITTRWQAPDRREEIERFEVGGRTVASVRAWFEGEHGGQATTFGQDQTFEGGELANAKANATLDWFAADPESVRVLGRTKGDDPRYVLEYDRTRCWVSARTGLVVERQRGARRERWSDFRNVEGRVVPFHAEIEDELGKSSWDVRSITVEEKIAPNAFEPGKPGPPSG